ncbi:MAG TPA: response regulator transcription factor [Candidatus Corynebacterium gallistercoris]|uniref:Response regulator transcription factor n=1 Tax=Candidatus Corynebacterium gallistercoris TaxID=2838530 RepID=A0A9D1UPJ2_9CORY|nr:response regulator transcription factor [Candidatus Corynebacterium gallistercoris]
MITVGLADDQQLVRAGFAMVLDSQDDMSVVWEAADGAQACELAAAQPVDIILMDVQMPVMDGITATRQILKDHPETKVVVLTTFDTDNYVLGSVEAGASGFLLKDADPEELIDAVRTVGESAAVISPTSTARLLKQVRQMQAAPTLPPEVDVPLTPREKEILVLMALGRSNQEIADELYISLPTVKTHVGRVLMKTDSRDRVHAVLYAFRHGLVTGEQLLDS